ncbi:hypothetical protein EON65_43005 [archaeon]|nr:MAG: hypothetical protein EON65_43005 [archaeon]
MKVRVSEMDLPTEAEDYDVIPVRTWVSGSPYKVKKSAQDFDSNQPTYNEGSTFEGGLENYFFGDEVPKGSEVEDERGDEDPYKNAYDENNEKVEDDEEEEDYEEEYEDDAENAYENENYYEQGQECVQEQEHEEEEDDAAVLESYQRLFPDEDAHITPELSQHLTQETKSVASDYLNAYQELMKYMNSPQHAAGNIQANLYVPQPGGRVRREGEGGEDVAGSEEMVNLLPSRSLERDK